VLLLLLSGGASSGRRLFWCPFPAPTKSAQVLPPCNPRSLTPTLMIRPLHHPPPTTARSDDPSVNGALYTARVTDTRPLSGETASNPRAVSALPFADRGDTSRFQDEYSCQAQDSAPDVVYAVTPQEDMQVCQLVVALEGMQAVAAPPCLRLCSVAGDGDCISVWLIRAASCHLPTHVCLHPTKPPPTTSAAGHHLHLRLVV